MFCKQLDLLSLFGFETQFRASMAANFHYVNRSRVYLRFRNSNEIELLIFRLCNLSSYNLAAWNNTKKADVMTSPGYSQVPYSHLPYAKSIAISKATSQNWFVVDSKLVCVCYAIRSTAWNNLKWRTLKTENT